jgi:SAM-dependent methyltransferase
MTPYTDDYYANFLEGARRSAEVVVPRLLALLRPRRVVDVGCGIGAWLAAFRDHGVHEVLGIDGEYVPRQLLQIPPEQFLADNLSTPLQLGETFDLALSLEVAEHLPPECAGVLVDSLTRLAPAVVFSAAIPHQGGTDHINEQWPEYWATLFEARGYAAIDCLRAGVWSDRRVEWWYAQNLLLYARRDYVLARRELAREYAGTERSALARVHPLCFLGTVAALHRLREQTGRAGNP